MEASVTPFSKTLVAVRGVPIKLVHSSLVVSPSVGGKGNNNLILRLAQHIFRKGYLRLYILFK